MRVFRQWHKNWRKAGGWRSAFTAPVPPALREALLLQQVERLHAFLPLLCLLIASNAVAMTIALHGNLPWWQQAAPPAIIITACLSILGRMRGKALPGDAATALHQLHATTKVAIGLGLVAGLWGVNAFAEKAQYHGMTAPVFIAIAALTSATCLLSAPRAAIAAMLAAVGPIVIRMASHDHAGVRAMAAMLVLVMAMQAWVVLSKFRESVALLSYQQRIARLAATDGLTGLDNRLAFMARLNRHLGQARPVAVILADLDCFKLANDSHGHQAGDAILVEVARRLRRLCPDALSVARLGGDEFALLFDASAGDPADRIGALRAAIGLPVICNNQVLGVTTSLGAATSAADGAGAAELLHAADRRLYADKAEKARRANGAGRDAADVAAAAAHGDRRRVRAQRVRKTASLRSIRNP